MENQDSKEKQIESLLLENEELDRQISETEEELKYLREEALEAKINAIAMYRLQEAAFESLVRSMGYVKSIHGYPEKARATDSK